MADVPFPLTAEDLESLRGQLWELFRQIYEEKIGGADLGDIFSITNDVLTLDLATLSGLTKTGNKLAVEVTSDGGLQISADGLSIKLVSTGGLSSSSSGLAVNAYSDGGLKTDANGLQVKLDGSSLSVGSSGLKVTEVSSGWAVSNKTVDRTLDCDAGDINALSDVVGTLIDDLKTKGILGA